MGSFVMNALGQPAYVHVQGTASSTWLISHGLDKRVVIDVLVDYKGQLTKIIPHNIILSDTNTVTIIFSKPMTGKAMIS